MQIKAVFNFRFFNIEVAVNFKEEKWNLLHAVCEFFENPSILQVKFRAGTVAAGAVPLYTCNFNQTFEGYILIKLINQKIFKTMNLPPLTPQHVPST
jgi:hypothetical protein